MMDKKELEIMELDNVSGGSWWNDLKNIVEDTYELVKDITWLAASQQLLHINVMCAVAVLF